MGKKKDKKLKKERVKVLQTSGFDNLDKVKYKRCKKCPCFDLIKKAA